MHLNNNNDSQIKFQGQIIGKESDTQHHKKANNISFTWTEIFLRQEALNQAEVDDDEQYL